MVNFRFTEGYEAPDPTAIPFPLGADGPQAYRFGQHRLRHGWPPVDFHGSTGYEPPGPSAADLAARTLIGDYLPPRPWWHATSELVEFDAASDYAEPDPLSVDFSLTIEGEPDDGIDLRTGVDVSVGGRWNRPSYRHGRRLGLPYEPYRRPDRRHSVPLTPAGIVQARGRRVPWAETVHRDQASAEHWGNLDRRQAGTTERWEQFHVRDEPTREHWGLLPALPTPPQEQPWIVPPIKDVREWFGYDHVDTRGPRRTERLDAPIEFKLDRPDLEHVDWEVMTGYEPPQATVVDLDAQSGGYKAPIARPPEPDEYNYRDLTEADFELRSGYSAPVGNVATFGFAPAFYWPPTDDLPYDQEAQPIPNVRIQPRQGFSGGGWDPSMPWRDENNELPWGPRGRRDSVGIDIGYPQEPPPPPPEPPPLPEDKRVYLLMPSIECKRVSDGAAVHVNAATVRTDRDSWCWQVDATLAHADDLDLVKPTSSGPVEIELTINGHPWRAIVESYRRPRPNIRGFEISGRSPSARLADPYRSARTFTQSEQRSAHQAADDELDNTDWTVLFEPTDWTIPAGVWSYQNLTPMAAIRRIAEAIGGSVYTHQTARELTIVPRYNLSPWEWASAGDGDLDAVLTESILLDLESRWEPGPGHNAVYVSGKQGGVIVHVVRNGTAQDDEAEMVVDELISDRLAGRERGRQVLAQAGGRERVSATTMLLPDPEPPGLLLPGSLVEVQENGETWNGQVMETTIEATRQNATTVRQRLEVERYHG